MRLTLKQIELKYDMTPKSMASPLQVGQHQQVEMQAYSTTNFAVKLHGLETSAKHLKLGYSSSDFILAFY